MSTDPLVGATLGNCRLEALVGAGGMGRVYRARHLVLDRIVAVKLVDRAGPAGGAAREAVLAEARAAAKLDDPRVVAVYDVGEDQGRAFIVMQWIEGETLEARVRRAGPLSAPDAIRVMRETAAALGVAHAAGIVHRDVKPANIMIDAKGAVKLTDFGLAGHAGSSTGDGATVGSYHFMPPEQGFAAAPHPTADFYSLGATWFYALTGRPPFKGTGADVMIMHREDAPPDIRQFRPDATVRSAGLLSRLLAKDPAKRPASAAEIVKELSNPSMLLETEESGSPFRILPPPTPEVVPGADAPAPLAAPALTGAMPGERSASAAAPSFLPPKPPPAPPAAPQNALGSRGTFFTVFGVIAVVAVGWPWRSAVAQDWIAGAAFLAAFPALLTAGDRAAVWRKPAAVLLWLGSVGCLVRFVGGPGGIPVPPLETMIVCALGAGASLGAVYMGLWGTDAEEVLWARVLAPVGGLCLAVSALAWVVPAGSGWFDSLSASSADAWHAWWASGGAWRWGGLAAVTGALSVIRRLKTVSQAPADGRKLNWNR